MKVLHSVLTSEVAILVTDEGVHQIPTTHPNHKAILLAVVEGSDPAHLISPAAAIRSFLGGRVAVDGDTVTLDGEELEGGAADYLARLVQRGQQGPHQAEAVAGFLVKVAANPSFNSRRALWSWANRHGVRLTKDGNLLLYKGVREDYTDQHSGTVDNRPGEAPAMDRSLIDDNPSHVCSLGFHAGSWSYVVSFGVRKLLVVVDPTDVVSVPNDSAADKIRMCSYRVLEELDREAFADGEPLADGYVAPDDDEDDDGDDDDSGEFGPDEDAATYF